MENLYLVFLHLYLSSNVKQSDNVKEKGLTQQKQKENTKEEKSKKLIKRNLRRFIWIGNLENALGLKPWSYWKSKRIPSIDALKNMKKHSSLFIFLLTYYYHLLLGYNQKFILPLPSASDMFLTNQISTCYRACFSYPITFICSLKHYYIICNYLLHYQTGILNNLS